MAFNSTRLTATDIKAIRLAASLTLRVESDGTQVAQLVKRPTDKDKATNPFVQDSFYTLPCGVRIDRDWKVDISEARAREYITLYRDCHARSVLLTLKAGDIINFAFQPDYGSTEALKEAGFHVDVLTMSVARIVKKHGEECYERFANFEIESRTTNSRWRMIEGLRDITPATTAVEA